MASRRDDGQHWSVAPQRGAMTRIRESVANTASHVVESVRHAGTSAGHGVSAAGSAIMHTAQRGGSAVKHAGTSVQHGVRQATHQTERLAHDYPLAAASVCFALGLAGGLALPRTRKEDELLGKSRDHLLDQARSAGVELLHKGEAALERAGDAVVSAVNQKTRQIEAGQQLHTGARSGSTSHADSTERFSPSTRSS
jgi:ElaB/YqjD/DUF883 family membrane-anchored ribosome-binding protein